MIEGNCFATSQRKYTFCAIEQAMQRGGGGGGGTCPQQNSMRAVVHSSMLHEKDYTV